MLSQSWARRYKGQIQCALEEGVVPKALDGVEVAFARAQQDQIGFEAFAVGHTRAHGEFGIDQRIDIDALEIFANKSQASMGAQVIGQFFDNEVGHVRIHLLGEQYMRTKSLISIGKSTYFDYEVTDSGLA